MGKRLLFEIGLAALVVVSFFAPNVWQTRGQGAEAGVDTVAAPQAEAPQAAPTTAFTYQGELKKAGAPYEGTCTFEFKLFTTLGGATQLGSTQTIPGVAVSGGLFTVAIDFGDQFNGQENFLQTGVQCSGDVGFTALTPRTSLKPAPYSISTSALRGRTVSDIAPVTGDFLAWDGSQWAPSARQARRKYYLGHSVNGAAPLTACNAGFHMANLTEIFDPTQLDYDTTAAGGLDAEDGGNSPPTLFSGWVRTGYASSTSGATGVGQANCSAWTSNNGAEYGTRLLFSSDWIGPATAISPWFATLAFCNQALPVWCVQD
jgi:hypothetical protein